MGYLNHGEMHTDLNRMILEIVLYDFESFESIVAQLSKAYPAIGSDEVKRGLQALLADDLLRTYLIHADPPYFTLVETPDTIEWYWFLITEEGERQLHVPAKPRAQVLQESEMMVDRGRPLP
jgi:hypothetical protein